MSYAAQKQNSRNYYLHHRMLPFWLFDWTGDGIVRMKRFWSSL